MRAVGVLVFIFGITSFALELMKMLYEFGNASHICEGENEQDCQKISNYPFVLD